MEKMVEKFAYSFSGLVRSDMPINDMKNIKGVISGTNHKTLASLAKSAETDFGLYIGETLEELVDMASFDEDAAERLEERTRLCVRADWIINHLPIYQPRAVRKEPIGLYNFPDLLLGENTFFSEEELEEMRLK